MRAMNSQQMPATKKLSRRWALGLLGAAPLAASGSIALARRVDAATANAAPPPPPALLPGGAFDRLLAEQAAQDKFSGTVLIAREATPVLARSYGMADKQKNIPNSSGTIFALASVTKLFTATAIIQLAEQGTVDLGRTLDTYLDGWPAQAGGTATVHQLLTHTSGMADFTQSPVFQQQRGTWKSAAQTMNGIMQIIRDSQLLFTPGTKTAYSNSGYATLGAIVGQVTGQSYAHYYDYVRTNIFARAGMTRSDFYTQRQWLADAGIARPYGTQPDGTRTDVAGQADYIGNPAGNAFSTAPDMIRFARALLGGRVLSLPWAELMTSPKTPGPTGAGGAPGATPPPGLQNMSGAYGAIAEILNNQRIVSLGGATSPGGGETANIDIYPDLDWDAVILSNYDSIDIRTLIGAEQQPITLQAR